MRSGDFDYRFLHDRMQQAAYECVPPDRNKTMHLDVAQFLMKKVNTNEDFTVRSHFFFLTSICDPTLPVDS